jgi:hypothetical protein
VRGVHLLLIAIAIVEATVLLLLFVAWFPADWSVKAQFGDTMNAVVALTTAPTLLLLVFSTWTQYRELIAQREELSLQRAEQVETRAVLEQTYRATVAPFAGELLREWRSEPHRNARGALAELDLAISEFQALPSAVGMLDPRDLRNEFRDRGPSVGDFLVMVGSNLESPRATLMFSAWEKFFRHERGEFMDPVAMGGLNELLEFLAQIWRLVEIGLLEPALAIKFFGGTAVTAVDVFRAGMDTPAGRLEGAGVAEPVVRLSELARENPDLMAASSSFVGWQPPRKDAPRSGPGKAE